MNGPRPPPGSESAIDEEIHRPFAGGFIAARAESLPRVGFGLVVALLRMTAGLG